ncbi:MAG: YncE family protein [Phycisphaeraceae bacterium]|nr:YncE family protein [Phycisphaeraceae bacterium]
MLKHTLPLVIACTFAAQASGQLIVSADEGKIDLIDHTKVVESPVPDSLTILDFAQFPPSVTRVSDISNSVLGPPSNLALTPDSTRLLVASSIVIDPSNKDGYSPDNRVQLLDLTADPVQVVDVVEVGKQPSGMCVSADGKLALVANRAANTISVIGIEGNKLTHLGEVVVCDEGDNPSDVDITPDGKLALVAVNTAGFVRVLNIDGQTVTSTERMLSTFGNPYRCDISDNGTIAVTNGGGKGNGRDPAGITIIDLTGEQPQTVQYVATGYGAESCAVSPDGSMVAVALINGSNKPADDPEFRDHGQVGFIVRDDDGRFEHEQFINVGRIPEGIAFTSDNRYVVVQCHPDRQLWVLEVKGEKLVDTGVRIETQAFPSGMTASR